MFKLWQQNNAFLFVRIRAGNDRAGFAVIGVERQVRAIGRDVNHVARFGLHHILKVFAPIHARPSRELINRGFVGLMFMRLGPAARWDREDVHTYARTAHCFAGDTFKIIKSLFPGVRLSGTQFTTIKTHDFALLSGLNLGTLQMGEETCQATR